MASPRGPYVADLLCREAKLIVDLDGAPHDDPEQRTHDQERDARLQSQGYRVLRFSNDLAIGGTELLTQQVEATLKAMGPIS